MAVLFLVIGLVRTRHGPIGTGQGGGPPPTKFYELRDNLATVVHDLNDDTLAEVLVGSPGAGVGAAGRATLVYGTPNPTDVDLATPGSAITLTGTAGKRFGGSVTGLEDTDLDGTDDFAISTNTGVYVVRSAPTSDTALTAADGFYVTGPADNNLGLSLRVATVPVADAGDIDGDQRDDTIVGYPDTNTAYTILSPQHNNATFDVTALPGQHGATNQAGSLIDLAGVAVGANTYQGQTPVSENGQSIVGAPSTANATGRAYIFGERTPTGPGPDPGTDEGDDPAADGSSLRSTTSKYYRLFVDHGPDQWVTSRSNPDAFIEGSIPGKSPGTPQEKHDGYLDFLKRTGKKGIRFGRVHEPNPHGFPAVNDAPTKCGWITSGLHSITGADTVSRPTCSAPSTTPPKQLAAVVNCSDSREGGVRRARGPTPWASRG